MRTLRLALLLFSTVLLTHVLSPVRTSNDSFWSIPVAVSMLEHADTNLDEYAAAVRAHRNYAVETVGGHLYCIYPLGVSVLALPAVAVEEGLIHLQLWSQGRSGAEATQLVLRKAGFLEKLVASVTVAGAAALIFALARRRLGEGASLGVGLLFAFCTPAWSIGSRALMQHGPTMLLLSAALYLLVRARGIPRLAPFISVPLALAFVVRPTNALSVAILTLVVWREHRRYFWRYLWWSLPVALPFLWHNIAVYGAPFSPYYLGNATGTNHDVAEALAANLVSPARGLFVFTPVLLFSLAGAWIALARKRRDRLAVALVLILVLHWLAVSRGSSNWWAGHSYGPRFMADMLPYFFYFLIGFLVWCRGLQPVARRGVVGALGMAAAFSFYVHAKGALVARVHDWNTRPADVDDAPERVWDWGDLEFLR